MKRRSPYINRLVMAWLLLVLTGQLGAQSVDSVVGAIPGSGGPGGLGGATYSIPIAMPDGLGGLKPGLGVVYNSQGGNGLLGWCWDIQGVSMVSRIGTTVYHDGHLSGVDFMDDRFALDGQRLVCIAGSYGADSAEYRTEVDAMARIVSYTCDTTDGPACFKVWYPDGNIASYGFTWDSRIGLQQHGDVCQWMLNRIEDRDGNYMTYHYNRGGASCELSEIRYGGNSKAGIECTYSVRLEYSPLSDKEYTFIGDNTLNQKSLLDRIVVKRGDNDLYRYDFSYHAPDDPNGYYYYRLKDICLTAGTERYRPTTVQWGENDYAQAPVTPDSLSVSGGNAADFADKVKFTGDFNGDGYTDVILYYPNLDGGKKAVVHLNRGMQDGQLAFLRVSPAIPLSDDIDWIYTVDLNGDGLDDIVLSSRKRTFIGRDKLNLVSYLSHVAPDGAYSLVPLQQSFGEFRIKKKYLETLLAGDFLGEGRQSFLLQEYEEGKTSEPRLFYLSWERDTLTCRQMPQSMVLDADRMFACDFNGDGISEVFFMNREARASGLLRMQLTTEGFRYDTVCRSMLSPWHQIFPGDFNGDGKPDVLSYVEDSLGNPSWHLHFFKETELRWPETDFLEATVGIGNPGTHGYSLKCLDSADYKFITVADLNGDGKADIAVRTQNDTLRLLYGPVRNENGQGRFASVQNRVLDAVGLGGVSNQTIATGVFLGNECANLLGGLTPYRVNPLSNRYSVVSVTDGMGNRTAFDYDYLMTAPSGAAPDDFYRRTPQTATEQAADMFTVSIPMKALAKTTVTNTHVPGRKAETTYRYSDAMVHKRGRGFLGFRSVTVEQRVAETRSGASTQQFESFTDVPRLALKSTVATGPNGNLLSRTESENGIVFNAALASQSPPKVFVPVVTRQSSMEFDPDHPARLLRKTVAETQYNDTPDGQATRVYDILRVTDEKRGVDADSTVASVSPCEFQTLVHTDYVPESTADLRDWLVSRPASRLSVARRLGGYADVKSLETFEYYPHTPHPSTVSHYPSGSPLDTDGLATAVAYRYDSCGAVASSVLRDLENVLPERRTDYAYSADGRFLRLEINAAGYETLYSHDPDYGHLLSETDPNGLVTTHQSTPLGTVTSTQRPDRSNTRSGTEWVAANDPLAPQGARYYRWTVESGHGETRAYFNALGDRLRTVVPGMGTEQILTDYAYNDRGLPVAESHPYYYSDIQQRPVYTRRTFDDYDRAVRTAYPDGLVDSVVYDGHTTYRLRYSGSESPRSVSSTVNAAGWTLESADENGGTVRYGHYADGKLMWAQVGYNDSTKVRFYYDAAGNRTSLTDPDYGTTESLYDAYGQTIRRNAPNGGVTEYGYDVLGRMTERCEYDVSTQHRDTTWWYYHDYTNHKGMLDSVRFNSGTQTLRYEYDTLNRIARILERRDGRDYRTSYTYDSLSRMATASYPSGFMERREYTATGHLSAIRDSVGNLLWQTQGKNAAGQLTRYVTGDGVTAVRTYDPASDRIASISACKGLDTIQRLAYRFDPYGNLTDREDLLRGKTEHFTYDLLERLTGVQYGGNTSSAYSYDTYGRMTGRNERGGMVFDSAVFGAGGRPHALGSARMYSAPPDQQRTYTAFDKLGTVTQDDLCLSYGYGFDHQRIWMVETDGNDTLVRKEYVGACEFVREGVSDKVRTYLSGPLGVFAVVEHGAPFVDDGTCYIHPDHLGSWTTVTNRNGTVVQDVFFDPWGTPYYSDSTGWVPARSLCFDRGFTGHEHLMDFGLVNMNGRVYDPVLGTFLSVDNYVQDPSYTQNFNRYAYCMNNPLKYTDPDGEWAHLVIGALIGGIVNLATNWGKIDTFGEGLAYFGIGAAAGAIGAATGGATAGMFGTATTLGSSMASGAISGAVGGFSSGFVSGAGNAWMQGANLGQGLVSGLKAGGKSALIGGALSGAVGGIQYGKSITLFKKGCSKLGVDSSDAIPDNMQNDVFLKQAQETWYPDAPMDKVDAFSVEHVPADKMNNLIKNKAMASTSPLSKGGVLTGRSVVYFNKNICFTSAKELFFSMGHELVHVSQFSYLGSIGYSVSDFNANGLAAIMDHWAYNYEAFLKGETITHGLQSNLTLFNEMDYMSFNWINNYHYQFPLP